MKFSLAEVAIMTDPTQFLPNFTTIRYLTFSVCLLKCVNNSVMIAVVIIVDVVVGGAAASVVVVVNIIKQFGFRFSVMMVFMFAKWH